MSGLATAKGSGCTFLHTGDWQLGMLRHALDPEAQARYGQARIDAIERIAGLARETGAAFVVVAGDVFDANQVDRQVVLRTIEALRSMPCPIYLLPGNHDSLEPGSVWSVPPLSKQLPEQVTVLTDLTVHRPVEGVEVVGLPWRTKRQVTDPMADAAELPVVEDGVVRVVVGHGQVDEVVPEGHQHTMIRLRVLEQAITDRRLHFAALGDRHSTLSVGETGRIWYSGTPEPTRPEEDDPGNVLKVTLAGDEVEVTPVHIGTWRLVSQIVEVDSDEALDELGDWLADQPDKSRTMLRLAVRGTLSVAGFSRLEMLLEAQETVYASIHRWPKYWDVGLRPDDTGFDLLDVGGPARGAVDELRAASGSGDTEAAEALALLHRLATG